MLYALDSMTFEPFAPEPRQQFLLEADTFEFKLRPSPQRNTDATDFVADFLAETAETPRTKPKRLMVAEIYVEGSA